MKKLSGIILILLLLTAAACNQHKLDTDASGVLESDEVIVSAEQNGKLLSFPIQEGDSLAKTAIVGQIDMSNTIIQKQQVEATIKALQQKTTNPRPQTELVQRQLAVEESQLEQQQREKQRTLNLLKADAATQKQLDDINSAIDQLQKQIAVSKQQIALDNSNIATQNRTIFSEQAPLEMSAAQIQDNINKGKVVNPIKGTVLTKYALQGEMTTTGKALYKIANLDTLILRAYVTGSQLHPGEAGPGRQSIRRPGLRPIPRILRGDILDLRQIGVHPQDHPNPRRTRQPRLRRQDPCEE